MHVHAGRLFTFTRNATGHFIALSSLLSFRAKLTYMFWRLPARFFGRRVRHSPLS